jgi:aldose 1-epimerase
MNKLLFVLLIVLTGVLFLSSCQKEVEVNMTIEKQPFGKTDDGTLVDLYTFTNTKGMEVKITNYGGIIVSIKVPDRDGKMGDVVLGYPSLEGYLEVTPYFGALIGRYGNRIAKGKFTLDETEYTLAVNNGENHLHGGLKGYDKVVWQVEEVQDEHTVGLKLNYLSPDGEEGYPGNLNITVQYTLTNDNEIMIEYWATTDKKTVINLTNHSYFNLAGKGTILNHKLMIDADRFNPVDEGLIPTGELRPVEGTPMDFTQLTSIGSRIELDDEQLKFGGGYDHNWVLNRSGDELQKVAKLTEPTTGRVMEIFTIEPGLQFYSGNFLDGTITGKENIVYEHRNGLCLETQHFPDSPNQPDFPSVILNPGEKYQTKTIYKFSIE